MKKEEKKNKIKLSFFFYHYQVLDEDVFELRRVMLYSLIFFE